MTAKSTACFGLLFLLGSGALLSCGDETSTIIRERCRSDADCTGGEVCELGECIPRDAVSCSAVDGGRPILQPGPPLVDFGQVGPATSERRLVLRNIGDCTLTLYEAFFESEDGASFFCPMCNPSEFPLELFPFRDVEIGVYFTPTPGQLGDFKDNLVLLSDDSEFAEIKIPVRARFRGVTNVKASPEVLDFGYVAVGRTAQRPVQISNLGSGTAQLVIESIKLEPTATSAFSFSPELTELVTLVPVMVDPSAGHTVNVRYHPRELGVNNAELVVKTNQMTNGTVRIPIRGTSQTPPKISFSPERIEFGTVPLGQTVSQPLTLINQGGSPLRVSYSWGGTAFTTDFSALPVQVPEVEPGQYTEIRVFVTATAPGALAGLLILETNDPNRPTVTIPVSAEASDLAGAQVLKVDMTFENGDDGWFGSDLRNVDMTLENPFGLIVDKTTRNPSWGTFGNPSWVAFGTSEEPERIVLPDATQDGRFRVILTYIEDCESVPTQLVASILGISVDVLITALLGVPVGIGSGQIADVISSLCLDRSGAAATITVYANGQVIAEKAARLGSKGEFQYVADIDRINGQYSVR